MNISMAGISGFNAARTLLERTPQLRIILASQHADPAYAEESTRLGIKGYMIKSAAGTELIPAIREVVAGRTYCSTSASRV